MRNLHSKAQSPQAGLAVKTPISSWLRVGVITDTRSSLHAGGPLLRLLLLCLLPFAFRLCALAQYSLDWYEAAGGGGMSTGGVYSLSGTIGQPDAGTMSGGDFTLTGGFWSLIAVVPTPSAPRLTITLSGNRVIVSWPYPSTGFSLQQNSNVANPGGWSAYGGTVNTDNGVNSITLTPSVGPLFFRLCHP